MDAKLRLCLLLIILGTLTVQGAVKENRKKHESRVVAEHGERSFILNCGHENASQVEFGVWILRSD